MALWICLDLGALLQGLRFGLWFAFFGLEVDATWLDHCIVEGLHFAGRPNAVDDGRDEEHAKGHPEDGAPFEQCGIWCHHAHQIGRHHARYRSNSVRDGHQSASIVGTHVQGTELHARIVGAHQAHADGEEDDDKDTIAASIGGAHHEDGRAEGSQSSHHLTRVSRIHDATTNHPVGHKAAAHRHDPHHHVGQGGVQAVGLDRELQHIGHILGQIRHHDIEAPIVTDLSADQRKHRQIGEDGLPGCRRQIVVAANCSNLLVQIFALRGLDERMAAGIAEAQEDLQAN